MASSDYYFFTDTNLLVAQTAGAYGPIAKTVSTDPDEYRVTSLHTATANPTAYAACDAILCVQRIPSTSLVNIILKPLVQPALNFAPVKYIIYKGILADSLIDTNGTDAAAPGNNDLTKFLWVEQAKKNASVTPTATATAPAKALGIDLTGTNFANTDPIDNSFYRAGVDFQLPVVKGGWSLGQFDKNSFGIEVLMEGLNFNHSLLLARQLENKVSVPALAGGANAAQKFDHWHDKEQVLGFMDPCAFYGSFFRAGVQAKTSGSTSFAPKVGNALYQDVLFSFANRNTAYLDIRNEHNFYFNYFGNYNDNIQVGNPLNLIDYYLSGWPILTLTASNFAPNNTTKARNAFQLRLEEGDNPKPLIYVSQGYRELRTRGKKFPEELTNVERFFDAFLPFGSGHTTPKSASGPNSLTFAVPNVTGQGATTPVSCYIRLKYLKQRQGTTTGSSVIQSANYLDNLIYPLDLRILPQSNASIKTSVFEEEVYVNAQDVAGLQCDFIARVGIARDPDNTSFCVIPTNIRTQSGQASTLVALSGETSDSPGNYPNLIASKYERGRVKKSQLMLSATENVPVAEFVSDSGDAARAGLAVPDLDKLFVIVVANATYDSWQAKIAATLDSRFRTYLGVTNVQTGTDMAGIVYTSFELILRGFAINNSTGVYEVNEVNTLQTPNNVKMYVRNDIGSNTQILPSAQDIKIVPKESHYVVVLDKLGFPPIAYPILEFDIKGPPNYIVDVQVSRDAPALLTGGPGLANAWDKNQLPEVRITQVTFSSWTNGDQGIVLDASGKATYRMPLNWWKDLARLPLTDFETATIRYRALAWPSTSATPEVWSAKDGAIPPKVLVRSNLLTFELIESGTTQFMVSGNLQTIFLGYGVSDAKKHVAMKFTVRKPNTTGMYTLVQWKRGSEKRWPQGHFATTTDYGIEHLTFNPDWTIDQIRSDPRYIDAVDITEGNDFTISQDRKAATTTDNPGGSIASNSVITHSFYAMDFDTRIHLNFEVPPAVTIVKQEDIVFQDSSTVIYRLVQGTIPPPTPALIESRRWKARILQIRKTDGTVDITHPETYAGP